MIVAVFALAGLLGFLSHPAWFLLSAACALAYAVRASLFLWWLLTAR